LNDFDTPLVYTPGDNEWTDCHRKEAGQKDPLKQLEFIRKLFFAENQSLGKRKLRFEQQSQMKRFSEYSENLLWTKESVLFATLHIVGSNNNYSPKDPSKNKEFEQRKNATVSWLHHISLKSRSSKAKAVVLFFHADLRFGKSEDKRTGYNEIIEELTKFVKTVNVPVLAVHGDSHEFIIDSPLKHMTEQGLEWPLDNFLRLEVFGAPDVRGVEVVVDTEKSQPFSFLPLPQIPWEY
ncbi:MAG: hypothetical protein KDD61_04855, partial [Bdellovibrionales bacterium]|nr:hypothetical protein [Bdellovibrionales bacterium]